MRILPCRSRQRFIVAGLCSFSLLAVGVTAADDAKRKADRGAGRQKAADVSPWWNEIDTGPFISDTFTFAKDGAVAALKGIAIKLGPKRDVSVLFDTELLAWRSGFEGSVVLEGTAWNGSHGGTSHIPDGEDRLFFLNAGGLGIGIDGVWTDGREIQAGPLPRGVGRYRGLFRHGHEVVLHYTVAGVKVLERPALETVAGGLRAITRTLNLDATPGAKLEFLVRGAAARTRDPRLKNDTCVYLVGAPAGVTLEQSANGRATVAVARGTGAVRFKIAYADRSLDADQVAGFAAPLDLLPLTRGGPGLFPQSFAVQGQLDPAAATKSYAVDLVPLPAENPWKSPPRFGGFDFLPGGKLIAASTWNGDVWIADGIDGDLAKVTWRRFASGLFQTLGLKVVDGTIYTQGRDQITRLHDLNGDGEADHYECFTTTCRSRRVFTSSVSICRPIEKVISISAKRCR